MEKLKLINQVLPATLYDNDLRTYVPPRSKMSYAQELMRALEAVRPSETTGTATAIHSLAERLGRRGLVILISDLFDDADAMLRAMTSLPS